jgi:hypothetical protein
LMATAIIIGVWGTLIYLVFLLIKIKKEGKEDKEPRSAPLPGAPVTV